MTLQSYLLTFLVIAISGNPAALVLGGEITYVAAFVIFAYLWVRRPRRMSPAAIMFAVAMAVATLGHLLIFGVGAVWANFGFLTKIGIGLFAGTIVKDFFRAYVRVMAILAAVSLLFYVPGLLGIDLAGSLSFLQVGLATGEASVGIRHIGIHNFHNGFEVRNSGMFWEPGAFAGYLVLAIFIAAARRRVYAIRRWEILALTAALISTQSTMGYLAGLLVGMYHFVGIPSSAQREMRLALLPVVLVALTVLACFAFLKVDFLGDKIREQILSAERGVGNYEINRFGNMLYDVDFIQERPLLGWSGNPETRVVRDPLVTELIKGQGSALTGFWVRFGLFAWLLFFWGLYAGGKVLGADRVSGLVFVFVIGILLVGEQYTNFPLIYAFFVPGASRFRRAVNGGAGFHGMHEVRGHQ